MTCMFTSSILHSSFLTEATCNYMRALPTGRIIGGTATRHGEFPWLAMLLKKGAYHCTCNILDSNHCLTAAHCFESSEPFVNYEVIAGKYTFDLNVIDAGQQKVSVANVTIHDAYNSERKENDLAVVRLSGTLTWSTYVMPACLPRRDELLPRFCVVAGWGEIQSGRLPSVLMKVEMQAYTNERCLRVFSSTASASLYTYVSENTVCAANGLLGGRDACRGDSGGPLMCMQRTSSGSAAYFIFGTVSNGNQCARPGEPGVYMDVREYLAWIQRAIAASP
ncbi:ovochymase-2 [Elysia marginata]|uniref:Ovochymase-2 n=1 Tax=Elysia marginata TaxID=1093978 RepID=A0AAV4I6S3_9GAST|nr:ovochymase-2 [Elysia marginata]